MQARLLMTGIIYQVDVTIMAMKYYRYSLPYISNKVTYLLKCAYPFTLMFAFQFLFKKYLSNKQWLSLLILTIGCVIQKLDVTNTRMGAIIADANDKAAEQQVTPLINNNTAWSLFSISTGLLFMFVQVGIKSLSYTLMRGYA